MPFARSLPASAVAAALLVFSVLAGPPAAALSSVSVSGFDDAAEAVSDFSDYTSFYVQSVTAEVEANENRQFRPSEGFSTAISQDEIDQQAERLSQSGLARLSHSGKFVAWRVSTGTTTYVRYLGKSTGASRWILREDIRVVNPDGFRWFSDDGLLYWTGDRVTAVWFEVDDKGTPRVRDRWGPATLPGDILDAEWVNNRPIATIDTVKRREAITQVRRVD